MAISTARNQVLAGLQEIDPEDVLQWWTPLWKLLCGLGVVALVVILVSSWSWLPLSGGAWRVVSYGPVEAPITVPPELEMTATFDWWGTVRGQAACNWYEGAYTVTGATMHIQVGQRTTMACVERTTMAYEATYLGHLQAVTTWSRRGNELTLFYAGGALRFRR